MKLELKASHFKDTDFINNEYCAVSKAARELFPDATFICEGVDFINIGESRKSYKTYVHAEYNLARFYADFEDAKEVNFSDKVIRTIELYEVE